MTVTEIEVVETTKEEHDDMVHLRCCNQSKAVCGTPVVEGDETDKDPSCVVCLDLGHSSVRHLAKTGHVHCPLDPLVLCDLEKAKREGRKP